LPPNHDYDLIFVSVQHYSFPEVATFLSTRVAGATVLVFKNSFMDPRSEVAMLPLAQVVWGFPQAGGGFDGHGKLVAALLPGMWLGSLEEAPSVRHRTLAEVFKVAGFKVTEERDVKGWLWVHFATAAGLHAQVLKIGSFSGLIASVHELRQAVLNIREMLGLAAARGIDVRKHRAAMMFRLPTLVVSLLLKAVWRLPAMRVIVQAHSNAAELKLTCRDALEEAHRIGFATPRLESLRSGFEDQR
jgi:2-dehydropantoate 2-reductase